MPQTPAERRQSILQRLQAHGTSITGAELARQYGVTRQVIVQDAAILRAEGHPIVATPEGYLWAGSRSGAAPCEVRRVFAVHHGTRDIEAEMNAIVDVGATVVDVIVDHPTYGEMRGTLMARSRSDVQSFLRRLEASRAEPLLVLTGGMHLHTVSAPHHLVLDRVQRALRDLGYLIQADTADNWANVMPEAGP